ncbi:Larval cuticle protein 16/17 [Amphibalanus amphitrite]|uniref:Larval cuticle protein 16/17 n=1 Tax=Amphibalanus amphitrite TaxID=1232801 RepID=A0A6A4XBD8_AMPAM|nr:larval cuticle protein LCP-22-like isoform X1 [Amphibalanus amphitrite]XP_043242291.1 larval cuticle protein LCP-22-like [Amphibalanus amphitrite]KAF0311731.1 Larval cuticle protein 16/17 [Amphibalanus amphitrite]
MKLLVIAALLAVAAARPQDPAYDPAEELRAAGIVRMDMVQNDDGSFQYGYETAGEGQESSQDVSGRPEQIGEEVGIVSQGTYSFVAKDEDGNDVPVTITWRAGPEGVVMEGAAIPVAPEDPNKAAQDAAYAAAAGAGDF